MPKTLLISPIPEILLMTLDPVRRV